MSVYIAHLSSKTTETGKDAIVRLAEANRHYDLIKELIDCVQQKSVYIEAIELCWQKWGCDSGEQAGISFID